MLWTGKDIQHFRERIGLNREEFAAKLNVGVIGRAVKMWEETYSDIEVVSQEVSTAIEKLWREEERKEMAEKIRKNIPGKCCERATVLPCVCAYSWTCPDHGDTHVGSHD